MLRKPAIKVILIAITLLLVLAGKIQAAPGQRISQQIDCNNPHSGVEEKYCAGQSYEAADRRLNQVYEQLTPKVSGAEKQELVAAQQAWIKFRDNNCDFETYPTRRGTGYGVFLNQCLEWMTKQRTADLEKYIEDR